MSQCTRLLLEPNCVADVAVASAKFTDRKNTVKKLSTSIQCLHPSVDCAGDQLIFISFFDFVFFIVCGSSTKIKQINSMFYYFFGFASNETAQTARTAKQLEFETRLTIFPLRVHRSPFRIHLIQSLTFFARICSRSRNHSERNVIAKEEGKRKTYGVANEIVIL